MNVPRWLQRPVVRNGPATSCGHNAPRLTFTPRCIECGHRSCDLDNPFQIPQTRSRPPIYWLIEVVDRLHVRLSRVEEPKLEGRIVIREKN